MNILDSLKGERRQEFEDFASRYDQGEPWEGISDDEAVSRRHDELASHGAHRTGRIRTSQLPLRRSRRSARTRSRPGPQLITSG